MIGQGHVVGDRDEQRRDADVSVAGLGDRDDCGRGRWRSTKQENQGEVGWPPASKASKARRCSGVMLGAR